MIDNLLENVFKKYLDKYHCSLSKQYKNLDKLPDAFFFLLSTCTIAFMKEDKRPKQLHHS